MEHSYGQDLEKDVACLSDDNRSLRNQLDEERKRSGELSSALCDMLFVFTCFEENGIEQYPEDMQNTLRDYRQKAAEAFVGHPLPPIPNPKDGIPLTDEFAKHLEQASETVSSCPEWKPLPQAITLL